MLEHPAGALDPAAPRRTREEEAVVGPDGRVVRDAEGVRLEFERTYDATVVGVWAALTGVGWELTLLGLAMHLAGAPPVGEPAAFLARPETQALLRATACAWGDAEVASGTDASTAQARAARTSEAYAPTGA